LQFPVPSQKPEQQASQPSLQLQVLPQFTPSGMQVSAGVKPSQMPELLQKPEQHSGQASPQPQGAAHAAPLSMQPGPPQGRLSA
jgi:hypothetical protein